MNQMSQELTINAYVAIVVSKFIGVSSSFLSLSSSCPPGTLPQAFPTIVSSEHWAFSALWKGFLQLEENQYNFIKNPLQKGFELLLFLTRFNRVQQLNICSVIVWLCGKRATFQADRYVCEPYYEQSILVVNSCTCIYCCSVRSKKWWMPQVAVLNNHSFSHLLRLSPSYLACLGPWPGQLSIFWRNRPSVPTPMSLGKLLNSKCIAAVHEFWVFFPYIWAISYNSVLMRGNGWMWQVLRECSE